MFQKLSRFTRHLFLFSLIVIAVILTAIRILVFCVDLYKHELEFKLSKLFAAPVTIGQLSAKMHRLHPEIVLKNIAISENNTDQVAISLKELRLGIDLMEVVFKRQIISASWISLVGAKLSIIRKKDGSFSIVGLKAGGRQPLWLLQGEHYQLLDSEISWLDEKRQGKPYIFKNIDLLIKNNAQENRHQLLFLSQLPTQYGKKLRISVDIYGNVFEPNSLNGELYIAGENIQFAKLLTGELPLKLIANSGSGNFKLWGNLKKSVLMSLTGKIEAKNLTVRRQKDNKKLSFKMLKGQFKWLNQEDNWRLQVQNLKIKINKKKWQTADFSIMVKNNSRLSANIKHIDLHLLSHLNQFITPLITDIPTNLSKMSLEGQLSNALIFADFNQQHYALKADFKKLGVKGLKDVPQFKNLSGSIRGNEEQGTLKLNSSNTLISAKSIFRKQLKINKLIGNINWLQSCENWTISSHSLQLDTADFRSEHKLFLKIPKDDKSSFIDMQAAFYDVNDVSKLKPYFPINSMEKDTLDWLDRAFVSGKVKRADMLLYGNLADFPFEKHQGVFQFLFKAQNLELAYAQGWENFKSFNAEVMFLNEGLDVNIKTAKTGKVSIKNTQVKILSLNKSRYLTAKVMGNGGLSDILSWLQRSPLDLSIKKIVEQVRVKGRGELNVDLKIPLTDDGSAKVTGNVKLKQASLNVRAIDLPVMNIRGILKFDEQHFYTNKLQAFTLGYPIRINIKDSKQAMTIGVSGKTSVKQLLQHFELPELKFAQGSSQYQLQLYLPIAKTQAARLRINSNLLGISLDLPHSLGKMEAEKKSLSVLLQLNEQALLPISVVYNKNLYAKLKLNRNRKKLYSGNILLGKGKIKFPTQKGINIFVNQVSFSPLPWLSLMESDSKNDKSSDLVQHILIKTSKLNWKKKNLGALTLDLKREKNTWNGFINSSFAKGNLKLPINSGNAKYKLEMDYINLSALKKLKIPTKNKVQKQQSSLPLVDIQSQQLIWRGVNLGRLDLSSQRNGNDIYFNKISIAGDKRQLSLIGHWVLRNNHYHTELQGQADIEKFGELLKKLDLNEDLKESNAKIKLALNWNGAPHQVSLITLNGNLDLHFNGGRISSIEPGFGRLLGVLAVRQWIKRLQLDFGDIYKEGLTFNSINGHYSLKNGKAYSDDLIVDAVPAKIILKGQLDLGAQTLNKEISVIPKSSAALPIAGTIVGGIATAIAQTVTGEYEEGFYLRSKYKVQGKWGDLKVTPLHEQDGLLQKTWRGLTDFSWINE